jgi:hypothetical protein
MKAVAGSNMENHGKLRSFANNTSLSVDREKEKAVSLLDTFH